VSLPHQKESRQMPSISQKCLAEFIGTMGLVLAGCGSAVLAATYPETGIGSLGVALAFGLAVLSMAYAFSDISSAHFNPAVSLGLWLAGSFNGKDLLPYLLSQVLGGIVGAGLLYVIASGKADFTTADGFAANGYGEHSPGGYTLLACLVSEIVMTYMFLMVILAVTSQDKLASFAPIAIGLALTLIHLVSIPVTNTSVNPARSTAVALFAGNWAIGQLWLFWVAPIVGAALAGLSYKGLFGTVAGQGTAKPKIVEAST
jgi:aquaporin Z